jgi:protein-tyrosine phosphatase
VAAVVEALLIDLHNHLLPGIDDGATDLEVSLGMARMAVADGVSVIACTPHILPGLYHNDGAGIARAIEILAAELEAEGIPLGLVVGADIHLVRDLVAGLRSGRLPTLHGSRYFLLEPPHHVVPPGFEDCVFSALAAGYVPIITHPERLSWIDSHYDTFQRLAHAGVWMQLTAGSVLGLFGRSPQRRSFRLLEDGLAHIIASDAHDLKRRQPVLRPAFEALAARYGEKEATALVLTRPRCILDDSPPHTAPPPDVERREPPRSGNILQRFFARA